MGAGRDEARALAELEKGLVRKDAEFAVTGLLALSPERREAHVGAVQPLFRDAVERARREGAWSRLAFWAARAEREPRLAGGDGAVCWALMWGCARCREWPRARRWFDALRPALAPRAPALARALEGWLGSEGRLPFQAVGWVLAAPPEDARLGREEVRARPPLPEAPGRPEEVEAAVLACCATQTWGVFARTVESWGARASSEVAGRLWPLAARLALREVLQRQAAGGTSASEPAAWLARAAREVEPPESLRAELLVAWRALLAALPGGRLERPDEARALAAVAVALARWPGHRGFVFEAVAALIVPNEAAGKVMLELMRELLRLEASASVWGQALRLWGFEQQLRLPAWLWESLLLLLQGERPFLAWLRALPREERQQVFRVLGLLLSVRQMAELVERCWTGADEELRRDMAWLVLARLELLDMLEPLERSRARARLELRTEEEVALWSRCLEQVLPYDERLLYWAAQLAPSQEEAWRATERYIRGNPGIVSHLETLRPLAAAGWGPLSGQVLEGMLREYKGDPEALAKGIDWCEREQLPGEIVLVLGDALADSVMASPGPRSARVLQALEQVKRWARLHVRGAGGRKPQAKKGGRKKGGSKQKGGSKKEDGSGRRAAPWQRSLFGEKKP